MSAATASPCARFSAIIIVIIIIQSHVPQSTRGASQRPTAPTDLGVSGCLGVLGVLSGCE